MYRKYIKRVLDFLVALVGLIIASPIFLVVAILIKIDSKGPVMFRQDRTGLNGKNFSIYKFRTMKVEMEENGRILSHDERTTKLGNVIRKLSIDELPQMINIIKGEMSFIGPRPWVPEYYNNFTEEQKKRVSVLPGITGLAQANGRNAINVFEKINLDIKYTESVTFATDFKIIIDTIKTVFTKHGAEIKQEGMFSEIEQLRSQFDEEVVEIETVNNNIDKEIEKNIEDAEKSIAI